MLISSSQVFALKTFQLIKTKWLFLFLSEGHRERFGKADITAGERFHSRTSLYMEDKDHWTRGAHTACTLARPPRYCPVGPEQLGQEYCWLLFANLISLFCGKGHSYDLKEIRRNCIFSFSISRLYSLKKIPQLNISSFTKAMDAIIFIYYLWPFEKEFDYLDIRSTA